jgi:hypothetical protein
MPNDPTPVMVTVSDDGTQPAVSAYTTLKVIDVPALPEPGFALPFERIGWCDAPLQLAA